MMKVDFSSQWAANTVTFKGVDNIYLRLVNEGQIVWYIAEEDSKFTHVVDVVKLDLAWAERD